VDRYRVNVSRSGKFWFVQVPDVPMGMTQARRIAEVQPMARDLIASLLDIPPDSFELAIRFEGDLADHAAVAIEARALARAAAERAEAESREAARYLVDQGLAVRDVAALLQVSPGWVSVLTREGKVA
jgi:hypothetical protein